VSGLAMLAAPGGRVRDLAAAARVLSLPFNFRRRSS
jgi:hypothetical protein